MKSFLPQSENNNRIIKFFAGQKLLLKNGLCFIYLTHQVSHASGADAFRVEKLAIDSGFSEGSLSG